jgi:hypothetical protein
MPEETKQIVKVKYYITDDELSTNEYSYYSEIPLNVGDIITVPVKDTTARACVSQIDVPESEVAAFKDRLKVIPAPESTLKTAKEIIEKMPVIDDPVISEALSDLNQQNTYVIPTEMPATTAVINVAPESDISVIGLYQESQKLLEYAQSREILSNADLTSATEDLTLIAKLKKAIEDKRKEYVNPIREKLDKVNAAFKEFTEPLTQADGINRGKIVTYRHEVERKRQEVEAIEREKQELARREAELNQGETTVDLTPIAKPAPVPEVVRTDMGNTGMMKMRKWEVEDISKVPAEYLTVDTVRIGKVVRAGIPSIPGIRIWEEETLRVNTR